MPNENRKPGGRKRPGPRAAGSRPGGSGRPQGRGAWEGRGSAGAPGRERPNWEGPRSKPPRAKPERRPPWEKPSPRAKPGRPEKPARWEKPGGWAKPERGAKSGRWEKPSERPRPWEKAGRPERPGRFEKPARREKPVRWDRTPQPAGGWAEPVSQPPRAPDIPAEAPLARAATVSRQTKETTIDVSLVLDGSGRSTAETGIPFFDHMLEQLGKHAGFDLEVRARGDLEVDAHHTVEDVGIAVGEAIARSLGDKHGIRRFGSALVPLDEALVQVALDLSARPFLAHNVDAQAETIGAYDTRLTEEFVRALVQAAGATLHVILLAGKNPHHIVEAEFKALAKALGEAVARAPGRGLPSTKGSL